MAAHVLGDNMDVHSGGEDLKFPHHDNEMAQSCAYFGETCAHGQWVNYWLHAGHLHIGGLKMSKSLKNFISIRQALELSSARQIRLLFLLQSWHGQMNYADDQIAEARAKEHQLAEFFRAVNALNRRYLKKLAATPFPPTDEADAALNAQIVKRQLAVDAALRDNFDYVRATQLLFELMNDANVYLKLKGREAKTPNMLLLNKAASFINDLLRVVGVVQRSEASFLGAKHDQLEAALQPALDAIAEYRAALTSLFRGKAPWPRYAQAVAEHSGAIEKLKARQGQGEDAREGALVAALVEFDAAVRKLTEQKEEEKGAQAQEVVRLTDELRDVILPQLGVKIEDVEGGDGSLWKLYEVEELLAMLASDGEAAEEKRREKLRNRARHLAKEVESWSKKAVAPEHLLATLVDEKGAPLYSDLDAQGLPASDGQGKPLSKGKRKKLPKLLKKQQAAHAKYLDKLKQNASFLVEMQRELKQVQSDL